MKSDISDTIIGHATQANHTINGSNNQHNIVNIQQDNNTSTNDNAVASTGIVNIGNKLVNKVHSYVGKTSKPIFTIGMIMC